jgi:Integrase core domain
MVSPRGPTLLRFPRAVFSPISPRNRVREPNRTKSYGKRSSQSLSPVAGATAVRASCMRCVSVDGVAARIASLGSCAPVACVPGKNVASGRKQLKAITNCTGGAKLARQDPKAGSSWPSLACRHYLHPDARGLALSFGHILDHCSRRCVGWHAEESLASSLVKRAWQKACANQQLAPGLLHHSDRGVQYATTQFQTLLHSHGATASMSRKANPYDNAIMESFFATLKTQCFKKQIPKSRREAN